MKYVAFCCVYHLSYACQPPQCRAIQHSVAISLEIASLISLASFRVNTIGPLGSHEG